MIQKSIGEKYLMKGGHDTVNEGDIEVPSEVLNRWQAIVDTLAKIADTPAGLIMKVDKPYIEVFRSSQTEGNPYEVGDREKLDGLYCEDVIESDERLLVENALESKEWADNPDIELGMISYLGYPLKWPNGNTFGTICTLDDQERDYDEETIELLQHFRDLVETQLALLFENEEMARKTEVLTRTESNLRSVKEKLKNLHDAVDQLQQQSEEESILKTAVEVSENALNFELCAIDLIEGNYLVTKAISSGISPDQTHKYKLGEGIGGITSERGETIWGDDLRKHPDAKPTSEDYRAFISVPIGEVGVFQVVSKEVGSFGKEDVELAEILSNHLREELNRVRLEEELRQRAIRDPLTDLYNRRYFNETLGEEVERCKRYDKSLAFLMADVNRFKEINDRYTHQTGDEVLKQVANLLEDNVRDADTVVRYGGDEFLVMMPETNGGVTTTVNRLKKALNSWNEQTDLLDFPLTLAMGVSHWSPDQDRDVEEALNEADKKMYEDKRENG